MPIVKNGKLVYVKHPEGHYQPGVHSKYIEEELDTDAVPLNGGVLVRLIAMSSDPYMRYRLREVDVPMFAPAIPLGSTYVLPNAT